LSEDDDAVHVVVHHALQATHLAFDAPQPLLDGVLLVAVPARDELRVGCGIDAASFTPGGYSTTEFEGGHVITEAVIVKGMTCDHCVQAVTAEVRKFAGGQRRPS
jgi:hypothetical protein